MAYLSVPIPLRPNFYDAGNTVSFYGGSKRNLKNNGKHLFQDATFHCLFDLKLLVYMCFGISDTVYCACVFIFSSIQI